MRMEQSRFVIEVHVELSLNQFPLFVDGEAVEPMIVERFRPPEVSQCYCLGRIRVTIELLDKNSIPFPEAAGVRAS